MNMTVRNTEYIRNTVLLSFRIRSTKDGNWYTYFYMENRTIIIYEKTQIHNSLGTKTF